MDSLSRTGGVVLRRVVAFLLDALIVAGLARAVAGRLADSRRSRLAVTGVLAATGGFPYHVLLEGTYGRTAGKRAVGLVVVSEEGGPCTYAAAFVRTALRLADWLPAGYLLGFVAIALTERDQRLGDLAAGTVVERE